MSKSKPNENYLRACIADAFEIGRLNREIEQLRAFVAEFEGWLQEDRKGTEDCEETYPGSYGGGMLSQARTTIMKFNELKEQHGLKEQGE
jgi:hypothetical protein